MELKIFSGRSNEPLAQEIIHCLDGNLHMKVDMGYTDVHLGALDPRRQFPDGELYVRYDENLRGSDVFIIQSTNQPSENDEELRMMIKTARSASAERVTAVIPYFGYARQDRKDKSRAPVSAVRKVIEYKAVGVDRVVVLDVHSSAVEIACEALDVRCDHLWARPEFVKCLKQDAKFTGFVQEGFVVAAPDLNAGKFARGYAENIWKTFGVNAPIALVEKRRDPSSGKSEVLNVIGDVGGKNVLLVDDMIDTGGTTCDAVYAFQKRGARRIFALATHGVFSASALLRINESPIEKVFITDSIRHKGNPMIDRIGLYTCERKLVYVSVAPLLAEAIFRIHTNQSVSSLFE